MGGKTAILQDAPELLVGAAYRLLWLPDDLCLLGAYFGDPSHRRQGLPGRTVGRVPVGP